MTVLPVFPLQHTRSARIQTEITALWQLAWPILVGQLANVGMAVADVSMAGHASAQDLAGVALGSSIWMIVVGGRRRLAQPSVGIGGLSV